MYSLFDPDVSMLACAMYVSQRRQDGVDAQKAREAWTRMEQNKSQKSMAFRSWAVLTLDALNDIGAKIQYTPGSIKTE